MLIDFKFSINGLMPHLFKLLWPLSAPVVVQTAVVKNPCRKV